MYKTNNKGFTLVELLAVIVILSGISMIALSSISSSLVKREARECEEQKQLARNAAKIYFSLKGGTTVTVSTLKSGGYFAEDAKTNRLKNDNSINYNNGQNTFVGECN